MQTLPELGLVIVGSRDRGHGRLVVRDRHRPRDARQPIWFRPREVGLLLLAGLADLLPDGRLGFVLAVYVAEGTYYRYLKMGLLARPATLNQPAKTGS